MNLENYFISLFENKYIGDDAAVINNYVYSKDAFFENVHFKKEWMSYYQIARKSMLVNISDAIAMNAKPKYILMSVAMPSNITKIEMEQLAQGFQDVAREFECEIIGGDTISNTKLDITITVVSYTKKPLERRGVKLGDYIAHTGTLGNSKKDLQKLFRGGSLHKKSKFINIQLRDSFVFNTARFLSAGMDLSDGLFSDLGKLSESSKVGFHFFRSIPKSVACSGEEYEILFAFSPRNKKVVLRRAKQSRTPINIVAKASRKKYINRCKSHHFKK